MLAPSLASAVSTSVMLKIAKCESQLHQFNPNGTVHRGVVNHKDVGLFQINETFWLAKSESLGFDIYTLKGNIEMAFWIADHYGTQPWDWSKNCWSK